MCIIAAKPYGVKMPEERYLKNMFNNNDDGAGFMYAVADRVYIEKGFMEYTRFKARLDEIIDTYGEELPLVMHFRITTHGGTKPENCHPFPVTDSIGMLKKLKCKANLAVAHNGIIPVTPRNKDISDTMEYIAGQLAPLRRAVPDFYRNKDLMEMVYHAIDSKMVIMNKRGEMYFVGEFIEEDGIFYSNHSYSYSSIYRYYPYSYSGCGEEPFDMGYVYDTRELMWLDDRNGHYAKKRNGEMIQDNFAIDKNGTVFYFEPDMGMFIKVVGATAHNFDGTPLKFDRENEFVSEEIVMIG